MAVTPERTPGAFGSAPVGAPYERAQPEDPNALAARVAEARKNERELQPLQFQPAPRVIAPSQSRLRTPGVPRPSVTTPAETQQAPTHTQQAPTQQTAAPKIILTDAPGVPVDYRGGGAAANPPARDPASEPVQLGQGASVRPERPAVDPETAAHLASPLAEAARKLQAQRALTHQPAASNTDSPSRGIPQQSPDAGKQITGGFGDAGDAQYFPLDGSELRELVRGLMSVIDEQLTHDLRFSMAIVYPRVAAKVSIEVTGYAAGGDGGQYDPSFAITKVLPPHEKTPIEIARERADQICFVLLANRVEMTPDGVSVSPPNQLRQELGLAVPRKQAVSTPTGRVIVDLPS